MLSARSVARKTFIFLALITTTYGLGVSRVQAEQIRVRYSEGVTRGFLVMRDGEGKIIAYGDDQQTFKAGRVTSIVTFRFKDGSFYQDTTVFSERGVFRVLTNRVIQKGPSFKEESDSFVDAPAGEVTVTTVENGKTKETKKHLDLPADVCNGILFILMKNIPFDGRETTVPMVAPSSTPRLIEMKISAQGEERFSLGLIHMKATHFVVKIKIEGVAGVVAPLIGKEPPDIQAWIVTSGAPVFVRSQGPLYADGPIWTIEFAAPEQGAVGTK